MDDSDFRDALAAEIPRLRRLASRVAPVGTDPDDLVQDTLERAWRGREAFRAGSAASTWLHRILVNRAQDLTGKTTATPVDVTDLEDRHLFGFEVDDPAVVLERAHDIAQLRAALSRLAPLDRMILALHDGEGWPVKDIAEACGLGTAAAHKRLQRGRFRLAHALTDEVYGISPPDEHCLHARSMAGDYFDGLLATDDRLRIEEHLRTCERCPPLGQALLGLRGALEAGGDVTPLHADVRRFLHVLASEV